jgi:hypothetical protein
MATTTTNFGFDIPEDSDPFKDGALAMRNLGNDVDARFGNVGTYPNQIVNVVSGVSRPVPYAMSSGNPSVTTSASVTLPSGRFTQTPNIIATANTGLGTRYGVSISGMSSSSFTLYSWNGTVANTNATTIMWFAVQMTSAAASN